MNTKTNNGTEHILNSPTREYTKRNPNCNNLEIKHLDELSRDYESRKHELDKIDNKTKELSSKIGHLKKEGKDISKLISDMQSYSKEKAAIIQTIKSLEAEILIYFESKNLRDTAKSGAHNVFENRIYPDSDPAKENITIKILGDNIRDWNDYVSQNQAASIYHLAEWRELIKKTFGHAGHYLYAIDQENSIKGILPLIHMKSRLFGNFLVSVPYFNYGGAVADHQDIELMLMNAAEEYATSLNLSHIEYRDDIPRSNYSGHTNKVNMVLALPTSKQELWDGFTPKLRAQIKRPQRENIKVQHGQHDLLDDFYSVFARNMRDLGTPVYGKSFFYNILNCFPDYSSILTVSLNEKPVAVAFLLGYGRGLQIPWASSLREVNHLSVNMLMYWEVLGYAIDKGFQYFDFGRSSKNAGTYKFKKQWGAKPKQSYWHYWLSPGNKMPSLNPHNPKFQLAIKVWKRLPLALTKIIGPAIVKNLP